MYSGDELYGDEITSGLDQDQRSQPKRPRVDDGLSRCDHCRVVIPHDQLIQVPHGWFCSYKCAVAADPKT